MTQIDTIKQLRDETGAGVMDAKRALEDANGDLAQARTLLRERGKAIAANKAGRAAEQGIVASYIHADVQIGVLVEIRCETDFVAKNPSFQELGRDLAMHIAAADPVPEDVEELMQQPFVKDLEKTVEDTVHAKVLELGEKITVERFVRYGIGR